MPKANRLRLIKQIEQACKSRVITLITGDRPVAPTIVADDLLRPLYDHLLDISNSDTESPKRIDLAGCGRIGADAGIEQC